MKHVLIKLCSAALLGVLAGNAQAQLLKGCVKSKHLQEDATLIYNGEKNGGSRTTEYIKLKFDEQGNFKFDDKMNVPYTVATVYLGDYSRWGVFLQKDKTIVFNATENAKKEAVGKYAGDNVQMSKFADLFVHSFELEHYLAFEPKDVRPYDECMKKLEDCYAKVKQAIPHIKDASMRKYYSTLADYENLFLKLRMRSDKLYKEKKDHRTDEMYQSLLNEIKVNDPVGLKCMLPTYYVECQIPKSLENSYGGDMTDYALAYMDIVNKKVTNQEVKKALAEDLAHQYFSYGKGNNVDKFWPVYKTFVGSDSPLIARYQKKVDATKNTVRGKKAPDTTFSDIDGKQHKLSDFFGKVTYIDVWATWCVPCCKEIPHLEKLVEHYKGNDKIQFISISVDSNHDAWITKLKKDKPTWNQFNLNREEDRAFSKAWNINGIPRFIMLDKEGNIYDADAIRPSDKDIINTLDGLIK